MGEPSAARQQHQINRHARASLSALYVFPAACDLPRKELTGSED